MLWMGSRQISVRPWRTSPWLLTTTVRPGACSVSTRGSAHGRGSNYSASMPDRITIYMATICRACRTRQEVVDLVRKTVIHEVGHHFGIDDDRLKELGWA